MSPSSQLVAGKWISVSAPGGMARQVCVDVFDVHEHAWKRVGTFADQTSAEQHARSLRSQGSTSRIVSQPFCPTAR